MRQRESGRYTKAKRDSKGERGGILGKKIGGRGIRSWRKGGKANKGRTVAWL